MDNEKVYQMEFGKIYQLLVNKAVKKGRTQEEVDEVVRWLTGYSQKELEEKEFTASAGGGAVEVKVNGRREVLQVNLAEEAVDPDDVEMLEDLIMVAVNDALRQVDESTAAAMSRFTGGLGGGLPF